MKDCPRAWFQINLAFLGETMNHAKLFLFNPRLKLWSWKLAYQFHYKYISPVTQNNLQKDIKLSEWSIIGGLKSVFLRIEKFVFLVCHCCDLDLPISMNWILLHLCAVGFVGGCYNALQSLGLATLEKDGFIQMRHLLQ